MRVELSRQIIVDPDVNERTLELAFSQWLMQKPRYEILYNYYIGNHPFSSAHEGQNMVVANFCAYIPQVLTGYQLGNEPRYNCAEDDMAGQAITELFKTLDHWNIEIQIAEDMSIFGKAFELVYMPQDKDVPRSTVISPRDAFVAYNGDIERDSVFGAVVYSYLNNANTTVYRLYVYDTINVSVWESYSVNADVRTWKQIQPFTPHGFGRVPLIEYKNNKYMTGDFEPIISLQDAYNSLLSDRQDNQDAFAQAMLVLSGTMIGTTPDEINEGKVDLRKLKVLQVDEDVVAQYLVKPSSETDIEILQSTYADSIHKFAMVPDLSDEQFAGNASGIALAYKLFGTDQIVSKKQAMMQKGYTRRCKLYDYRLNNPTMNPAYTPVARIEDMVITFNLNVPQDLTYIATATSTLTGAGILSKQTARTLISVISDPKKENELVDEENQRTAELTRDTYGYDPMDAIRTRNNEDDTEDEDADTEE